MATVRRWICSRCFHTLALVAIVSLTAVNVRADPADGTRSSEKFRTSRKSGQNTGPTRGARRRRYTFRKIHDPHGIGKFYMGREIAHVMGFPHVDWLERPEREKEERLSALIQALALKPGLVVADIGAGSGVISVLMAEKVGPKGKVIAVDIQEQMLKLLSKKLKQRKITNVEPRLGTPKTPRLKPASCDLAILVDVYHEFRFPYEMLLSISKAIKPGGRVVFVEYRKEDPQVPILLVHKMTEAQVKKEAALPEFRLKWKKTIGTMPWQHIVVFERAWEGEAPAEPRSPLPRGASGGAARQEPRPP